MSEEEKKAIEYLKALSNEKCECVACQRAKREYRLILNLIEEQKKEIKDLKKELEKYRNAIRNLNDAWVSKDKIREFFEGRLLKYTEADDGIYDKPYLTRGELELVDRYGECKEIAEILLAEKIEIPKESISKDKIRGIIEDCYKRNGYTAIALNKIKELLEEN